MHENTKTLKQSIFDKQFDVDGLTISKVISNLHYAETEFHRNLCDERLNMVCENVPKFPLAKPNMVSAIISSIRCGMFCDSAAVSRGCLECFQTFVQKSEI